MRLPQDTNSRVNSALQLLTGPEISVSTFENVRSLIKGLHPGLDKKLEICSKALDKVQKVQNGDIISLTAEHLPERDEEEKRRKKALLFFIDTIKNLKSEIKRVSSEFQSQQGTGSQMMSWGRIIKFAKGPLGLVTLVAICIVVATPFFIHKTNSPTLSAPVKQKIQVITYQGKELPLSQLYVGHGPDCDSPHYHATTGKVTAMDGSIVVDPEGCGFGKVADVQVITVEK